MDNCEKCDKPGELFWDDEFGGALGECCLPGSEPAKPESGTICLDTPELINMWVLLSRRAQIKLHMKGLKVNGLVKWCKANIEGCENARTVRDCIVPVEYAIAAAGGPQDFSLVNVHCMINDEGIYYDQGVFSDMRLIETNPTLVDHYEAGTLELVYTLEDVRPSNNGMYVGA